MHFSRSQDAVIRVYGDGGNVIETHEHMGEFSEPRVTVRHFLPDSFGASEATIPSKRGSRRSGSQNGESLSIP